MQENHSSPTSLYNGYRLLDLEESIRSLPVPVTEAMRTKVVSLVDAGKKLVAEASRSRIHTGLRKCETEEEAASRAVEELAPALKQAEATQAASPDGSVAVGALCLLCFLACLAAEYVFNLRVLTWLTGVSPVSALGIMLGLAPSAAPVILDRVIVHLFQVEDPWGAMRSAILNPFGRAVRILLTALFVAAVGAMNVYLLWPLAATRGIVTDLMTSTTTYTLSPVQKHTMEEALLMVTLCLTINGALFYLYGLHEFRLRRIKKRAERHLEHLREQRRVLETQRQKAHVETAEWRRKWENVDVLGDEAATEFQARTLLELQRSTERVQPAESHRQRVVDILDARFGAVASNRARTVAVGRAGIA